MIRRAAPLFVLVALTRPALADDTHYNDYPIGGRAVGLGGAFVALSDDPSGLYYNPAGIVDSTKSSLQVSTNLYGIEVAVSDQILSSLAQTLVDFDRVFAELQIIPTTAGFVQGIGARDKDGRFRHTFGLGAFVPSYRSTRLSSSGSSASGAERVAYRRDLLDRTIQACASYAFRVDETWSLGLTAAAIYRTLSDQESTSIDATSALGESRFNTASTELDLATGSMSFTVGFKARVDPVWTLGLAVSAPAVHLYDAATLRVTRSFAGTEDPAPSFELFEPSGVRAETKNGASVRAGFAHLHEGGVFTGDLILHAPVRYRLLTVPAEAIEVVDRMTLTTEIERRLVLDLAVGFETMVASDVSVAFGFWTDFSSAPPIEGPIDRDRLPDIDAFGGSMLLGLHGEHTLTRAGLSFTYGSGDDVIAQNQELRPIGAAGEFHQIELQQLLVFFFVSSTFMY
jgi:hypothetical protein